MAVRMFSASVINNEDGKSFEFRPVDEYTNNEQNRFIVFHLLNEPVDKDDDDGSVIVVFQVKNDVPIEAMMNFMAESGTVWKEAHEGRALLLASMKNMLIEKDIMHVDDYIDKYFILV